MAVDLKVPSVGESITEVFIGSWLKREGEAVEKDEPLVEVETDKATLEVPASVSGVLSEVLKKDGESAQVGEVIARIEEGAAPSAGAAAATAAQPEGAAEPAKGAPAPGRRGAQPLRRGRPHRHAGRPASAGRARPVGGRRARQRAGRAPA